MAQIFPNLVTANVRPDGLAAPIQTKKQAATGTGSAQSVSLLWDGAYPYYPTQDYDVQVGVEATSGDGSTISVGGFTKSATGIVVSVTAGNGQTFVLHATAFNAGPGNS
jgi:hypothetical protein